jgi:DNA-binding beta-propeller fold protein YncE
VAAAFSSRDDRPGDGKSIWVFDRCASNDCGNSTLAPIQKFDASGKFLTSFGGGMFNQPHGFYVDREGNVWVADERAKNGKGAVVVKFSPEGKVLMTLGKAGMPGNGPELLDGPSGVVVAPNGDIYYTRAELRDSFFGLPGWG